MIKRHSLGESKAWENLGYGIWRAPIPGGWLVASFEGGVNATSLCFIPDAEHHWDGHSMQAVANTKGRGALSIAED